MHNLVWNALFMGFKVLLSVPSFFTYGDKLTLFLSVGDGRDCFVLNESCFLAGKNR